MRILWVVYCCSFVVVAVFSGVGVCFSGLVLRNA